MSDWQDELADVVRHAVAESIEISLRVSSGFVGVFIGTPKPYRCDWVDVDDSFKDIAFYRSQDTGRIIGFSMPIDAFTVFAIGLLQRVAERTGA